MEVQTNQLIKQINSIYQGQLTMYQEILKISQQQMALCEAGQQQSEEVFLLINQRLKLMHGLDISNNEVGKLKQQVVARLTLDSFTIKQIKAKVDLPELEELSHVLDQLGKTLRVINDHDEKIKNLYGNLNSPPKLKANPQQANSAYRKFLPPK